VKEWGRGEGREGEEKRRKRNELRSDEKMKYKSLKKKKKSLNGIWISLALTAINSLACGFWPFTPWTLTPLYIYFILRLVKWAGQAHLFTLLPLLAGL
jgi:hypothetical protein